MSEWMDAEAHADRALELYERGRWAEAERELRKAISLNPDQAEWHYNLGLTLEAAGRDEEALVCYERSVELLPDQPEPLVAAAMVSNRLERYSAGLDWCARALILAPTCEPAYAEKISALAALGNHDEAEVTFYLAQQALDEPSARCLAAIAESLLDRGEFQRAGWCLREALRLEPGMPRLRARLAAVLAETGRPQQAVLLYLRELRDDPGGIDTLLDFGDLLIDLDRLDEAAEKFRRVLELQPANTEAHERLGRVAMRRSQFEAALAEFDLVSRLDPEFPGVRLSIAEAALRSGGRDRAVRELRVELERLTSGSAPDPADESGGDLMRLGTLLVEVELFDEAAVVLERVGSDRPEILRLRSYVRFRVGDIEGGTAEARELLRREPACVVSMHNLALAAIARGDFRTAAAWISRGMRIDRHDPGLRRLRVRLVVEAIRAAMGSLWRRQPRHPASEFRKSAPRGGS